MPKKVLELIKIAESQFHLRLNRDYFGKIKAIPNQSQTKYAIIYEQQISAISGPPLDKEVYIKETSSLGELEKIAETYSKKIAKENCYYFKNKANLSAKNPELIIVDKSKAHKRYPIRETDFTKNSRLNH